MLRFLKVTEWESHLCLEEIAIDVKLEGSALKLG